MKISICKHQFFGDCKCSYDVDKNHHPNNFDCPKYEPMGYVLINIEKEGENAHRNESTSQALQVKSREDDQA
jgi:hypothetical protein